MEMPERETERGVGAKTRAIVPSIAIMQRMAMPG
jgi:hypothetical protein